MTTVRTMPPESTSPGRLLNRTVCIIAPAYNERECISGFISEVQRVHRELLAVNHYECKLVIVDDGSSDRTFEVIAAQSAPVSDGFQVIGLQLSRNFGQQAAIQAGLEYAFHHAAPGSFFVVMDSDLQHPPKLVLSILEQLENGIDHVQMIRHEPAVIPFHKRATSVAFYWFFRKLTGVRIHSGSSDFRGLSYTCLRAYLQLQEKGRFNRGLFHWIGFKRCEIVYQAAERRLGHTKYSLARMLSLGVVGLLQFSSKPLLWICSTTVALSFLFCAAYLCFELVRYLQGVRFAIGWPSLIFFITFWSGAIALSQLVISIYLARLFDEMKGRPIYIVRTSTDSGHDSPTN